MRKNKSSASVDRKGKSVWVNRKKISSENSSTVQNKSTNITDDSSNYSYTITEDTPLEKHEVDNQHIEMGFQPLGTMQFKFG